MAMAVKKDSSQEDVPPRKGFLPEVERAVLGYLMTEVDDYDRVMSEVHLTPDCFSAQHLPIFTAIAQQHALHLPFGQLAIGALVDDQDTVLINEMCAEAYVISAGNIVYYCTLITDAAHDRLSKQAFLQAAQRAVNGSPFEAQAWLADRLTELSIYRDSGLKPFKSIYDVLAMPKPEWLLAGLIQRKTVVALVADGGTGKSWFMWDWAMHFTLGRAWLSRETKRCHIFYLAGEGDGDVSVRVGGWVALHKIDPARVASYFHFEEKAPQLLHEGETDLLMARIRASIPPDEDIVIFIDTLSTALDGGDINEHKDISAFMRSANRLKIELGATVVVATHTNKQGGFLGSSALKNDTDATFLLTRTSEQADQIEVRCLKQRGAPQADPITFGFKTVYTDESATETIRLIHLLEAPATPPAPPLRETHHAARALQALVTHPDAAQGITQQQWREAADIERGRPWERVRDQLEADGYVIKQPGRRGLWVVTDTGIELFAAIQRGEIDLRTVRTDPKQAVPKSGTNEQSDFGTTEPSEWYEQQSEV